MRNLFRMFSTFGVWGACCFCAFIVSRAVAMASWQDSLGPVFLALFCVGLILCAATATAIIWEER